VKTQRTLKLYFIYEISIQPSLPLKEVSNAFYRLEKLT
jgi:hypothetical protein